MILVWFIEIVYAQMNVYRCDEWKKSELSSRLIGKKLTFSVEQSQWFVGWFGSAAVVLFAFQMRIFNDMDIRQQLRTVEGGYVIAAAAYAFPALFRCSSQVY